MSVCDCGFTFRCFTAMHVVLRAGTKWPQGLLRLGSALLPSLEQLPPRTKQLSIIIILPGLRVWNHT